MTTAQANQLLAKYAVQIVRTGEWKGVAFCTVRSIHGGADHEFRSAEEAIASYQRTHGF